MKPTLPEPADPLPLQGVRVLEWGHTIMGPVCSLVLADMGADVIKIERAPRGDDTRRLPGAAMSYFSLFNRDKKSIALDLKRPEGKAVLRRLIARADVFIENFGPDADKRLGFGHDACKRINPRLVYCNLKGFMPGPYWNRPSLDHLAQIMGGLAYMTGRQGDPLRAGASITDIMAGVFGALGIVTSLYERERTGKGRRVVSALYETVVFMVAQHMASAAVGGLLSVPMPEVVSIWAVYDLFDSADGGKVFIGLTSDAQFRRFCDVFGLSELKNDPCLASNNDRVAARDMFMPRIRKVLSAMTKAQIIAKSLDANIPFAPLTRPDELCDDPHLNESNGLVQTTFASGVSAGMPRIPVRIGEHEFGRAADAPAVGQSTRRIMLDLGYDQDEIDALVADGIIVADQDG
jgi:crotonobetainyl-CoA:carnitine CoA-transferase CaiB-like acyl-CoA transferase